MLVLVVQSKATEYEKLRHRPTLPAAERANELIDLLCDGIRSGLTDDLANQVRAVGDDAVRLEFSN
jgi:hypothetical protein